MDACVARALLEDLISSENRYHSGMAKPTLKEPQRTLEAHLIDSMQAGLHEWRPDLYGPASYSDYQACARGILRMFKIERAPLPIALEIDDDFGDM